MDILGGDASHIGKALHSESLFLRCVCRSTACPQVDYNIYQKYVMHLIDRANHYWDRLSSVMTYEHCGDGRIQGAQYTRMWKTYQSLGYKSPYRDAARPLGILLACHRIYSELHPLLHATNTFVFGRAVYGHWKDFMSQRTTGQLRLFRSLTFLEVQLEKSDDVLPIKTIQSLRNLRALQLRVHYSSPELNLYNHATEATKDVIFRPFSAGPYLT